MLTCMDCGEEILGENEFFNDENELICEQCSENYVICDECGEVTNRENITTVVGGDDVCEDCLELWFSVCDSCGRYMNSNYTWMIDQNDTRICWDCCQLYATCNRCSAIISLEDINEDINIVNGRFYCDECAELVLYGHIHNYDYRPDVLTFFGTNTESGYGVELEIDRGDLSNEATYEIGKAGGEHIYLKHDGSLTDDGFEIVTYPCSLAYHSHLFPWDNIIATAQKFGYRSHDTRTCGLHVHASRELLGNDTTEQDLTAAKIIILIDFFWDQYIVPFSRRNYSALDSWAKKPQAHVTPQDDEQLIINKTKDSSAYERYKALNLQNSETIEFRFFRGTLKKNTILATLEWIDILINYCKNTSLSDLWVTTWDDIFGNSTGALNDYLKERKIGRVK